MPLVVTIDDLSGSTPYDIYLCDDLQTLCIYISRVSSAPYQFEIPTIMTTLTDFSLKVVDSSGCEVVTNLSI